MRRFFKKRTVYWRLGTWLLLVGSVLGIWAFHPQTAQADPHAMFYTAIGQQQLFFNFLAALDQADYVEPKDYGAYQRDALLDLREKVRPGAPYGAELQEHIRVTETDLSAILVRQINLAGQDVQTVNEVRELALEGNKRRDQRDLSYYYCELVWGIKECDKEGTPLHKIVGALSATETGNGNVAGISDIILNSVGKIALAQNTLQEAVEMCGSNWSTCSIEAAEPPVPEGLPRPTQEVCDANYQQCLAQAQARFGPGGGGGPAGAGRDAAMNALAMDQSFVLQQDEWNSLPFQEGIRGVLNSGTEKDTEIRKKRMSGAINDSREITGIKELDKYGSYYWRAYSDWVADLRKSVGDAGYPNFYEAYLNYPIELALAPGRPAYAPASAFAQQTEIDGEEVTTIEDPSTRLANLALLPAMQMEAAIKGADRVMGQMDDCEWGGLKCDYKLKEQYKGADNPGELSIRIQKPPITKDALQKTAADAPSKADAEQVAANTQDLELPEGRLESVAGTGGGPVAGVGGEGEMDQGAVAGAVAGIVQDRKSPLDQNEPAHKTFKEQLNFFGNSETEFEGSAYGYRCGLTCQY